MLFSLASLTAAWSQGTNQELKISLNVENEPAANVAAEIAKQSGVQIAVTEKTDALVTLALADASLEEAVKALAECFEGSWMRAYVIEQKAPPTPYTAKQLADRMLLLREDWMDSMSDDERMALFTRWRDAWRKQREEAAAQMQTQPTREERRRRVRMDDPIRALMFPERLQTISLNLVEAPLKQAQYAFMAASGYIALAEVGLDGVVGISVQDASLDEALDQIAAAVDAKWRRFYLLCEPKEFTDEELQARGEAARDRRWARFWAKTPEERAAEVDKRVERIQRWAERASQPAEGDRPNRRRRGLQRIGPRIMSRLAQYSAGLTPEQRLEIKPILKAMGAAVKRVQ